MKKKQNGTNWKQTLTKSEIVLLGLTALFLLFVFRGRGTDTKSVKVHALPKPQSEPQSNTESDSVPESESENIPAESENIPETEPENIPAESENIPAAEPETVVETQNSIADSGKMNLNTASAAELETLPGIGPALAGRIVEYRETNGPFHFPEELMDVSGIGEGKYQAVADLVTTE